jgi:hypothetical protein
MGSGRTLDQAVENAVAELSARLPATSGVVIENEEAPATDLPW